MIKTGFSYFRQLKVTNLLSEKRPALSCSHEKELISKDLRQQTMNDITNKVSKPKLLAIFMKSK